MGMGIELAERGWVPDFLVRRKIRKLDALRLSEEHEVATRIPSSLADFARKLAQEPLAVATEKANEQHYEVPAVFFQKVLGPRLKYSSCFYESGHESLADAEVKALQLTCAHAELCDGQAILELGCGWGSLALWMAENYPKSRILTLSNSASQREYIQARCAERGISNLQVITNDINTFQTDQSFDRVVSVEMFEHLRNYRELFRRISGWLKPEGKLFCHIFCHARFAYLFEDTGEDDWMARQFFTGGMMPAEDLFQEFQEHLNLQQKWRWSGRHYALTAEHWLHNMDTQRAELLPTLSAIYGRNEAALWFQRWRIFFMACAELFAFDDGNQWGVCHYLFRNKRT